jgi:ribosomal protein L44E
VTTVGVGSQRGIQSWAGLHLDRVCILHTVVASTGYCMDADTKGRQQLRPMMPPRQPLNIVKLSDHGGQYIISLRCEKCRHRREARPETFARLTGWETPLKAVLVRLRCSKCGERGATATARRETKRDG